MPRRRPPTGPTRHGLSVEEMRMMLTGGFSVLLLRRLLDDAVEAEAYEHAAMLKGVKQQYPEGLVVRTPANGDLFDLFKPRFPL